MKILFLTLLDFKSINEHNIYTDLIREFVKNGHFVYVISPVEKRSVKKVEVIREGQVELLKLKIGNIQKTNLIEKGISTIALESMLVSGIRKYFSKVKFDLVLYSTPPITFQKAVQYIKKRDGAKTYLLLKDIFPQNSVDIGMLSKKGPKSLVYWYFRRKEEKLYALSDKIGCMSQANVEYVLKNNPWIRKDKVEICPNSIEVLDMCLTEKERREMRQKYDLPLNKKIFVYGGNLGKPQGIPFLIKCLYSQRNNPEVYFLIIGDGTEYGVLESFYKKCKLDNFRLMKRLAKEDYDSMVAACDVGMIFLDYRFTIPNFPSRILSYMQAGLPVLACTDSNTDVGEICEQGKFGWWCESKCLEMFEGLIPQICRSELKEAGKKAFAYLQKNYNVKNTYKIIVSSIESFKE